MAGCRWILPCILIIAAGCRNRDLVENELRARDNQFREAVQELGKSEARNQALLHELETLRRGNTISPELAAHTFGLKRIVLGRGTGGYDNDSLPGDEALQAVIEPRDHDDHTIKTPGSLYLLVLEIGPQGIKQPLCSWTIDAHKLQKSWKQGLLSTGYTLVLPWPNFPRTENLRVVARLVLPDGRVFETDKDIRVRLVPGAVPRLEPSADCPPGIAPPVVPPPGPFTPEMPTPVMPPAGKWTPAETDVRAAGFRSSANLPPRWEAVPLDAAFQLGAPIRSAPPTPLPD